MDINHNIMLTGPEITSLWTQYLFDSLSLRVNTYMYHHLDEENTAIREIFKEAISISENNLQEIESFFKRVHYPIPLGFTEHDVNLDTPKLYSDNLCLKYLHEMTIHGLSAYSVALTVSSCQEMRQFYGDKIQDTIKLYNQTIDVLLSKGLYHRPPYLPAPVGIDFIKTENFFDGFFSDRRTLNGPEISNVFFNLKKSIITKAIITGFCQVISSKDSQKVMKKALGIKQKHIELFSQLLTKDQLPAPPLWDSDVSDSTVPPFSDKLMMFLTGFLFNTAIAYYGAGLGATMRSDLVFHYEQFILEDLKFAEDWTDVMVNNQWLEQPPKATDRKKLAEN